MIKYRWYLLRSDFSLLQIAKRFRNQYLTDERAFGFMRSPNEDYPERLHFRHVRRTKIQFTVADRSGGALQQTFETLSTVEIQLFEVNKHVWLRVENPPRSLRDLLGDIETVLGLGISITPISFDLKQQRRALRRVDSIQMVAFKGIGSSAEHKALARFEVASKEGVDPDRLDFLSHLEFKIDHATFEVVRKMLRGQVAFSSSGLVRLAGPLVPYLLQELEVELTSGPKVRIAPEPT